MFSTAFHNDSAVASGTPKGGARGWRAPFARGKFWNQEPRGCYFLASKRIAIYLSNSHICANFPKMDKYYFGKN